MTNQPQPQTEELARLKRAINEMGWRMERLAFKAYKKGDPQLSRVYRECADIVRQEKQAALTPAPDGQK